eukprot:scaffold13054_cov70-Attheya_sp.AAC.6
MDQDCPPGFCWIIVPLWMSSITANCWITFMLEIPTWTYTAMLESPVQIWWAIFPDMESHGRNEFHVSKKNGMTRVFKESNRGLFLMEMAANETGMVLVNTVVGNKSNFSNIDYSRAMLDRQVQKTIGCPSISLRRIFRLTVPLPNVTLMLQKNLLDLMLLDH